MFAFRNRAWSRAALSRAAADPLAGMTLRQIDDLPPWHEASPPSPARLPAPSIEALVLARTATRLF